jgi:hypothetical protein
MRNEAKFRGVEGESNEKTLGMVEEQERRDGEICRLDTAKKTANRGTTVRVAS